MYYRSSCRGGTTSWSMSHARHFVGALLQHGHERCEFRVHDTLLEPVNRRVRTTQWTLDKKATEKIQHQTNELPNQRLAARTHVHTCTPIHTYHALRLLQRLAPAEPCAEKDGGAETAHGRGAAKVSLALNGVLPISSMRVGAISTAARCDHGVA